MRPDLITLGCDPGVDGAVVTLEWRGPVATVAHLHLVGDGYKPPPRSQAHDRQAAMVRALRRIVATIGDPWPSVPVVVAVEAATGRPGQAQIAQGAYAGIAAAALAWVRSDRFAVVPPGEWTRGIGVSMPATARKSTLTDARAAWLADRHPRILEALPRVGAGWHDGAVDAACIAIYARSLPAR